MSIKQELRRAGEVIRPSILAGMNAASEKTRPLRANLKESLCGRDSQPEMVYISVSDCLSEEGIREAMTAVKSVYRSGRIPVCPRVMFPSDSVPAAVDAQTERKMRFRLMDVCQSFLICGSHWTEEMCAEARHAITRGLEIRTDQGVGGYFAACPRLSSLRTLRRAS